MAHDMEWIKPYRQKIDDLDDKIVDLLVERIDIIRQVGHIKAQKNIPSVIPERVNEVRNRNAQRAEAQGLDAQIIKDLYTQLIDYSCRLEDDIKRAQAEEDIFG